MIRKILFSAFVHFLGIFSSLCQQGRRPSPGGVSGVEAWFVTAPVTTDLQGNYRWQDLSGEDLKLRYYNAQNPEQGAEYTLSRSQIRTYNFHPAIDWTEVGYDKTIYLRKANLAQATVIGVFGSDYGLFSRDQFLFAHNGRAGGGFIATKGKIVESVESGKTPLEYGVKEGENLYYNSHSAESSENQFRERALRVMSYYRSLVPQTNVWGERWGSTFSLGDDFNAGIVDNTSSYNTSLFDNIEYWGYTPELIAYARVLSPVERRRVESYLAVKYAFTLEKSYLSNKGDLVWDLEKNAGYNRRVAGVAREDGSGLYQDFSTTSYQEQPYYSDQDAYDSYQSDNSNNKSSGYRLLAGGRQNGSALKDGEYMLWGDDGGSLSASRSLSGLAGMKLMGRNWLLATNRPAANEQDKEAQWTQSGINFTVSGFTGTLVKSKGDALDTGILSSVKPLESPNGYFSFDAVFSLNGGQIEVKFGTVGSSFVEGAADYGYRINASGYVYPVVRGKVSASSAAVVYSNQKIEFEKQGNLIYLWVNGVRQTNGTIAIAGEDLDKTYYGSISVKKGAQDITLRNFRWGGFSDTGNRLELGYYSYLASDFAGYRSGGKTFLVIDRSGTGSFPGGQVDYYPADDLDEGRYKILFNNIFWDSDGNGRDVFTFGYKQSNIVAEIAPADASCDANTGLPKTDGKIEVNVKQGYSGFSYQLTDKNNPDANTNLAASGVYYSEINDKLNLPNLKSGTYILTLKELGGTNLINPTAQSGVSLSSTAYSSSSSFEFTAIDNSKYEIGFTTATNNSSAVTINYGVRLDGYRLYPIVGGSIAADPVAQARFGDRISVARTASGLTVKLGGAAVYTQAFSTNTSSMYLGANQYGEGRILNIKITGSSALPSWRATSSGVKMELSSNDEITREVVVGQASCEPVIEQPPVAEKKSALLIYYRQSGGEEQQVVRVTLASPSPVDLLVFDMNGRLLYEQHDGYVQAEHEFVLRNLSQGTYIVKALADTEEYSGKAIIRP